MNFINFLLSNEQTFHPHQQVVWTIPMQFFHPEIHLHCLDLHHFHPFCFKTEIFSFLYLNQDFILVSYQIKNSNFIKSCKQDSNVKNVILNFLAHTQWDATILQLLDLCFLFCINYSKFTMCHSFRSRKRAYIMQAKHGMLCAAEIKYKLSKGHHFRFHLIYFVCSQKKGARSASSISAIPESRFW